MSKNVYVLKFEDFERNIHIYGIYTAKKEALMNVEKFRRESRDAVEYYLESYSVDK